MTVALSTPAQEQPGRNHHRPVAHPRHREDHLRAAGRAAAPPRPQESTTQINKHNKPKKKKYEYINY
ncbi:hypothetical protein, partial [Streptomyces sp. NPDC006333]|uniref:hypothetical protein n=1 Tax=Streptomyces sp. NPDC006333 TaxID=3156753 RepID=UPI0033A805D5